MFVKNLVQNMFLMALLMFGLSTEAAVVECVLAPVTSQLWTHHNIRFTDTTPYLEFSYDMMSGQFTSKTLSNTGDTYYFVFGPSSLLRWSGLADSNTLKLPGNQNFEVYAYPAVETKDGLVLGSSFFHFRVPATNTSGTDGPGEVSLRRAFTGQEQFLKTPIISVASPDSFQVAVQNMELVGTVPNIAVLVEDTDSSNVHDTRKPTAGCFADGARDGDIIQLINAPSDRTLYVTAYTYATISGNQVAASQPGFAQIIQSWSVPRHGHNNRLPQ